MALTMVLVLVLLGYTDTFVGFQNERKFDVLVRFIFNTIRAI